MDAGDIGASHKVEADGMPIARTTIELKPEHIGSDLGCALNCHPAH